MNDVIHSLGDVVALKRIKDLALKYVIKFTVLSIYQCYFIFFTVDLQKMISKCTLIGRKMKKILELILFLINILKNKLNLMNRMYKQERNLKMYYYF